MDMRVGCFGPFDSRIVNGRSTPWFEAEILIPVDENRRLKCGRHEPHDDHVPFERFLREEVGEFAIDWWIEYENGHLTAIDNQRVYFRCRKKALVFLLMFSA